MPLDTFHQLLSQACKEINDNATKTPKLRDLTGKVLKIKEQELKDASSNCYVQISDAELKLRIKRTIGVIANRIGKVLVDPNMIINYLISVEQEALLDEVRSTIDKCMLSSLSRKTVNKKPCEPPASPDSKPVPALRKQKNTSWKSIDSEVLRDATDVLGLNKDKARAFILKIQKYLVEQASPQFLEHLGRNLRSQITKIMDSHFAVEDHINDANLEEEDPQFEKKLLELLKIQA